MQCPLRDLGKHCIVTVPRSDLQNRASHYSPKLGSRRSVCPKWSIPVNRPDAKRTIALPLIKIQDKQRSLSVHFIRDRKHVYLFVLGFFSIKSF